jgi:hypothetical protein
MSSLTIYRIAARGGSEEGRVVMLVFGLEVDVLLLE